MALSMGTDEQIVKELEARVGLLSPQKAKFVLTNRRLHGSIPRTLLGLIPSGSTQITQPLRNVSNVGVQTRFSVSRLVVGLGILLFGLGAAGSSEAYLVPGIVLIALGVIILLGTVQGVFSVSDSSGNAQAAYVSFRDKNALIAFAGDVNRAIANVS